MFHLIVGSTVLSLRIQDTRPVVGFKVELGVDIDLHLNVSVALADGVDGDTGGAKGSSEDLSNSGWAPADDISRLQAKLGSEKRVFNGAIGIDLTERQGLVDRGALVTEGKDTSLAVHGNANRKTSSHTRSGLSGLWEIGKGNAGAVFQLGRHLFGVQCRLADELMDNKM